MKVLFATCDERPEGTADDRILKDYLMRIGVNVEFKIWSDKSVAWAEADRILIRSTWDYHRNLTEFLNWTKRVESDTKLSNSFSTLKWNSSKRYLLELAKKGIPIIPSHFSNEQEEAVRSASKILLESGDIVVKPSVSATAELSFCVCNMRALEAAVIRAMARGEVIIQPFISSIKESGELSLIYFNIGGDLQFSHAVHKRPQPGDFRVQSDFGGSAKAIDVSNDLIELGYRSLIAADQSPLYARVDIVDWKTQPRIGELELIEPELFFRFSEVAVSRFADAIIEADY